MAYLYHTSHRQMRSTCTNYRMVTCAQYVCGLCAPLTAKTAVRPVSYRAYALRLRVNSFGLWDPEITTTTIILLLLFTIYTSSCYQPSTSSAQQVQVFMFNVLIGSYNVAPVPYEPWHCNHCGSEHNFLLSPAKNHAVTVTETVTFYVAPIFFSLKSGNAVIVYLVQVICQHVNALT